MTPQPPSRQSSAAVEDAAERIFQSGILDEIVDAASSGQLHTRDAMEDAAMIARVALEGSVDA